jgi:diguanylate cyclase (GGDEF)-like protein/PAS domain S-box-containing protein
LSEQLSHAASELRRGDAMPDASLTRGRRGRTRRFLNGVRAALPSGQTLPDAEWRRRHGALLALLWAHVVGIPAYAVLEGYPAYHAVADAVPVAAFAVLATKAGDRRLASLLVSLGLLTSSAVIVHLSGGYIEAHFHFFVMIAALTLYEDWLPFLVAGGYVVLHHGVLGVLERDTVYNHGGNPWYWAAIHGGFVTAAGAAAVISWRLNEDVRARMREAEERFKGAFDHAPIGMSLVSTEGRWLQVNRALCQITGYSSGELLERGFTDITHPDDLDADLEQSRKLRAGEISAYRLEKRFVHANGQPVWVSFSASRVDLDDGEPLYLITQVEDISERKRLEQELEILAQRDPLTGLLNRRRFDEELSREAARVKRYGDGAALLMLDLDDFKQVNDRHGHRAGDQVITGVAKVLAERLRTTDTVGRLGGDEFAVILPRTDATEAAVVARKLVESVRGCRANVDGERVRITASIGIALMGADAEPAGDDVLVEADRAMYEAKRQGGDRFMVSDQRAPRSRVADSAALAAAHFAPSHD